MDNSQIHSSMNSPSTHIGFTRDLGSEMFDPVKL